MEPAFILEGSGEALLAQAEKWRHLPRLRLMEVPIPDYAARLPADVVWENGVPLFPARGNTTPVTSEMVKAWLEEDE